MVKTVLKQVRDKLQQLTQGRTKENAEPAPAAASPKTETSVPQRKSGEVYEPRKAEHRHRRSPEKTNPRREEQNPNSSSTTQDAAPTAPEQRADESNVGSDDAPRRRRRRRGGRGRKPADAPAGEATTADRQAGADAPPPRKSAPPPAEPWDPAAFAVEPEEGKTRFHDLDLPEEIMHAILDLGFRFCTPIQAEILPHTLKGQDAYGRAQTGTGKSAAFLITIISHILRNPIEGDRKSGTPRALVIAPTRELAIQIEKDARDIADHCHVSVVAVYGGMDYDKQRNQLHGKPVDIVIATPGRLLDFRQRHDLHLGKVEIMVIDEADRMLDMGFIPDVRRIISSTPPRHKRQTLLFSATLTPEVIRLASQWTIDPATIEIEPEQVAVDTVEQLVYILTAKEKFPLLYNLITKQDLKRVMVFVNRRDQVRRLTEALQDHGIDCEMLTGEVPQNKRLKTLEAFREGRIPVMVATDVAGRGIHIDGVSHVVNYTLPVDPEDYVHRIGRTGRAGASGISVSFACESDSFHIPDIEAYIGRELKCTHPDEALLTAPPPPTPRKRPPREESRSRRGGSGRGGSGRSGSGRSGSERGGRSGGGQRSSRR